MAGYRPALHTLQVNLPDFDIEVTLLKVAAINQLYGTNVYAVVRMAQHVTQVMQDASGMEDTDLVEELATLNGRKHRSFASKFAHFFIDMERFPIFDSFAVKMVTYRSAGTGQRFSTSLQSICREYLQVEEICWIVLHDQGVRSLSLACRFVSSMVQESSFAN